MNVTAVTVIFLAVALLVAVGIVAAVAWPRLRRPRDPAHSYDRAAADEQRHRSRTRHEP